MSAFAPLPSHRFLGPPQSSPPRISPRHPRRLRSPPACSAAGAAAAVATTTLLASAPSGSTYAVAALLLASTAALLVTRGGKSSPAKTYALRVKVNKELVVALPAGGVVELVPEGDVVLHVDTEQDVDELSRGVVAAGVRAGAKWKCIVYRCDGANMVQLREFPRGFEGGWG